jgi:hypothetical protein
VSAYGRRRDFTIGDLGSIEPLHIEIAIRDFPIGSGPSIVRDTWGRIPKSRGSGNRGFQGQRNLVVGNHDPRYPDDDVSVMGPLESKG